jgi:DHA1 family multidrug resistance protein-like MFS transporter
MSFIYGLLYVFLSAYPIVFPGVYGMNLGVGGLPFLGLVIGQLLAGLSILLIQDRYNKKLVANNNVPIPEW